MQLSAMLLGRSPELGIWAFTERRSPTIDEAFLPLDTRTATAVIERLNIARNRRQCGGETRQISESWKTAGICR